MLDKKFEFPNKGLGEDYTYGLFEDAIRSKSARLGSDVFFAHMDPPTPKIAAKLVGLNAQFNQNLLHPDLSPFATEVESQLINLLAPDFGMTCGHMCGGSTLGNLTALWRAREAGAVTVIASEDSHLSVAKSAHILGMDYQSVPVTDDGRMQIDSLGCLSSSALVLTAGTTGRGAVDPLDDAPSALWTHVDAAWAGPLVFTKHKGLLNGIQKADSVAVSSHKWLYQPKDSALIFFKDPEAQEAISFGGSYLAIPNVGVQGSRSAAAIPLMATLMAWGRAGLAKRIEADMQNAQDLALRVKDESRMLLKQMPTTAVFNWQPKHGRTAETLERLRDVSSQTKISEDLWVRQVAANPKVDLELCWQRLLSAVG